MGNAQVLGCVNSKIALTFAEKLIVFELFYMAKIPGQSITYRVKIPFKLNQANLSLPHHMPRPQIAMFFTFENIFHVKVQWNFRLWATFFPLLLVYARNNQVKMPIYQPKETKRKFFSAIVRHNQILQHLKCFALLNKIFYWGFFVIIVFWINLHGIFYMTL